MTLFSLRYNPNGKEYDCAVDWDSTVQRWSRSEKPWGLCQEWRMDLGLGEEDYNCIRERFGISPEVDDLDFLVLSPKKLSRLGKINPQSDTMGDDRVASDVD